MQTDAATSVAGQTQAGSVVALWRYPVKSMMGEELNSSEVTDRGLLGDRQFAIVDRATGKVGGAKNPRKWGNFFDFFVRGRGFSVGSTRAVDLVMMPHVVTTMLITMSPGDSLDAAGLLILVVAQRRDRTNSSISSSGRPEQQQRSPLVSRSISEYGQYRAYRSLRGFQSSVTRASSKPSHTSFVR